MGCTKNNTDSLPGASLNRLFVANDAADDEELRLLTQEHGKILKVLRRIMAEKQHNPTSVNRLILELSKMILLELRYQKNAMKATKGNEDDEYMCTGLIRRLAT